MQETIDFCSSSFMPQMKNFIKTQYNSCHNRWKSINNDEYCKQHFLDSQEVLIKLFQECYSFKGRDLPTRTLEFCWDMTEYLNGMCSNSTCNELVDNLEKSCIGLNKPPLFEPFVLALAVGLSAAIFIPWAGYMKGLWKLIKASRPDSNQKLLLTFNFLFSLSAASIISLLTAYIIGWDGLGYGVNDRDLAAIICFSLFTFFVMHGLIFDSLFLMTTFSLGNEEGTATEGEGIAIEATNASLDQQTNAPLDDIEMAMQPSQSGNRLIS